METILGYALAVLGVILHFIAVCIAALVIVGAIGICWFVGSAVLDTCKNNKKGKGK